MGNPFRFGALLGAVPYADLHVHTTNSDGELTIEEVPDAARAGGVAVVAITDHDRLHPGLDAPTTEREGITVIHGIELRVEADDGRVDLLGYGIRPTPELTDELDRIQADRIERGRRMIEGIEEALGVDLAIEAEPGIGRPHIARAVATSDADYGYDEAFEELIGTGEPLYVSREVPSFERGRSLLDSACGLVGLAHPLRYDDPEAALALTEHLDAVERFYPYDRPVDTDPIDQVIESHGLVATGGSDAHDRRLGRAGVSRAAYRSITECLP